MDYANRLDALLWRNEKQSGKDSTINGSYQSTINTAIETYNTLWIRFPKSAYLYNGLRKTYLEKGDQKKLEYTQLLKAAALYADSGIYGSY